MPLYRVAWKNKDTGASGHGEAVYTMKEAEQNVETANREWPEIKHWIELAEEDATNA